MKILMINPSQAPLPIKNDLIRADTSISIPLAKGLLQRKHTVFFLTSKDSDLDIPQIKADIPSLFSVIPEKQFYAIENEEIRTKLTDVFFNSLLNMCKEIAVKEKFDLLHIHSNFFITENALLHGISTPILVTLHSIPPQKETLNNLTSVFNYEKRFFISISQKQREFFPYPFVSTVYHGIDIHQYQFDSSGRDKMLFSGRLRKIKGIIDAIQVSIRTRKKLSIVGKSSGDNTFVEREIIPAIQKNKELIVYDGSFPQSRMHTFYTLGKLTLFPINWDEPFGLVQIESMSCGTPVIAYARGSVPEIVKDGETGFIVNPSDDDIRGNWIIKKTGIEGLCEAVEKIYSMPEDAYRQMRKACRAHVEDKFTREKMVQAYERVYYQILSNYP
ncbi:MAG: glycosyltransferase [Patescibacteria group bacterium]